MAADNATSAPVRRTAAQRRAQLAELAARRFQELGYHHVSLADVAADAGITAPALYRHFRNKQGLLAGAIGIVLDAAEDTLAHTQGEPLEAVVAAVAELTAERRYLWALLQREVRFLEPEARAGVQERFTRVVDEFARRLVERRPELARDDARVLVTAATSALASPSVPRSAPRSLVVGTLSAAATAILHADLPREQPGPVAEPAPAAREPADRRTELLDTAIDLFFERGFTGVSLDDIGAAIGIAGPSIYHHFPTKTDILLAAFTRATDRLAEEHSPRGERSLAELVGTYTDFCLQNRKLVGIYVWETMNLPPDAQRRITAALRARVSEWSAALRPQRPEEDERAARIRVHAALTVIDDLVRLGRLHERPLIAAEARHLAMTTLTGG